MVKDNQDGFTLLELMIAFSIFSILIVIVYGTFYTELKKFYDRSSLATMTIESNNAMNDILKVINENGSITVAGNTEVSTGGSLIIDTNNDSHMDGSLINLDESTHTLLDQDGMSICQNVKSVSFIQGPSLYDGVGITAGMLLIEIVMEDRDVSYTLKGGVNLAR